MENLTSMLSDSIQSVQPIFDYLDEISKGSNIPLTEAATQAFKATKVALTAWFRLFLPLIVLIIRFFVIVMRFGWDISRKGFEYAKPYLKNAYQYLLNTYKQMTPRERITLAAIIGTTILLYLFQRWIERKRFVPRFFKWVSVRRAAISARYNRFMKNLRKKSRVVASLFPHLQFALGFGLLLRLGIVNWLLESSAVLVLAALVYPALWTLDSAITMKLIRSDSWRRYIIAYNRYADPILSKMGKQIPTPANSPSSSSRDANSPIHCDPTLSTDINAYIPPPFLTEEQKSNVLLLNQTQIVTPTPEETVELDAVYNSDVFLAQQYQSLQTSTRYWVSLSMLWLLYHIPVASHTTRLITNSFPSLPLAIVLWLQFPMTNGSSFLSSLAASLFARYRAPSLQSITRLLEHGIEQSSRFVAKSKTEGDEASGAATSSPGSEQLLEMLKTMSNTQGQQTSGASSIGGILSLLMNIFPAPLRRYLQKEEKSGGLILLLSFVFLFTPGFLTAYGVLLIGMLRPMFASLVTMQDIRTVAMSHVWFDSIIVRVHTDTVELATKKAKLRRAKAAKIDALHKVLMEKAKANDDSSFNE